jgi:TonB-linked SusC/RagA family outer membrane protein
MKNAKRMRGCSLILLSSAVFLANPLPGYATGGIGDSAIAQVINQQKTVTGTVIDEQGEPLIGVSVLVQGTTTGTVTDVNGKFTLANIPANATLSITYIGYQAQNVKVGDQRNIKVVMKQDNQVLDEVVVVGYGVVKKSDLTGSVGSVKSETLTAKGATSVMESLQGQVAGVNITQASSRAGDGFNIQIRGKSTMSDDCNPLYVIDGVVCDNMDFLNPMDIEKVDVLKDASSTAIYGSRATNGVVMITTKKGDSVSAKPTVSYDGYYGVKKTANMPEFMSGDEYLQYRFSRYLTESVNTTSGVTTWSMKSSDLTKFWCNDSPVIKQMYLDKNYTNWPDLVTRDGQQQNHFINISGNAKNISYRVGLGYQQEDGVLYDSYERWNIKGAVDHKISDKLSVGFSTNLATSLKQYGSQNSVKNGFDMNPTMAAYYWEGENAGQAIYQPGKDAVLYPNGGGPTSTINPLVDRENSRDNTRTYNAMANVYLQYSPIKEVILKTTFSPMYQKSHEGIFYGAQTQVRGGSGNQAESQNDEVFSYTWDTQANIVKDFGDHSFNLLGLFSVYQQKEEGNYMKVTNMPFDVDWYNLGSGTLESRSSYYRKIAMLSWVARLNYSYKGRYLLTISSRWDGSSKFAKDNRWGMFPSAAVAWRVTEEEFMKSTENWLSNLKVRLSYGITGNNAGVGAYSTQSLADLKKYYNFGSTVANGYAYTMSNSALTWEKTNEFNFGLDFGFLKNRITGSIDVYRKVSKDLLMDMQTPYELGSSSGSIKSNVGKVRNKGIEAQLTTINYRDRNWNWQTTFTFAKNKNAILELNGEKSDLVGNKWFIGQPIDVIYSYKYLGVCTAEQAAEYAADPTKKTKFTEGTMIVWDKDGNGTIDSNDRTILGHCAPTWTGSLNSTLNYKNIDFSFSIYTSQGGYVYSPFYDQYYNYSQRGTQHLKMDYYIPDGAPILAADGSVTYQQGTHYGVFPFPTGGNATSNSGGGAYWERSTSSKNGEQNCADNSYVKVKNITVGYTFPKAWMSKVHISNLRVYVNILNPFTFTDYKGFDPEWADASISDGSGGVSSRTYQVGVNLKF